MAMIFQIESAPKSGEGIAADERRKSLMLRVWIVSGLVFMALPGTLLGFANLMAISTHRGLGNLPEAWLQGHGHAQLFGWIGSFILGIGFYSQPSRARSAIRVQLSCFAVWTSGVAMRWLASIYAWHWRALYPLSAGLELTAVLLFLAAASRHKMPEREQGSSAKPRMELWMVSVLMGTTGLAATVIFNLVECVKLAIAGASRAFPHGLDQKYLVLAAWGFVAPVVWGFSARWLPSFLGLLPPNAQLFSAALIVDLMGVLCGVFVSPVPAAVLLAGGAVIAGLSLHLAQKPLGRAKVQGIHPSFPIFIRLAYAWLVIAGALGVWAALDDRHGGIWGASRHALTVGFAASMVFAVGPRILPHFSGISALFSKRLMLISLLLLQAGCTLRVGSEPLAYEGILPFAWKTLPLSGMLELSGVLVFAANLVLTLLAGKSAFAQVSAKAGILPAA